MFGPRFCRLLALLAASLAAVSVAAAPARADDPKEDDVALLIRRLDSTDAAIRAKATDDLTRVAPGFFHGFSDETFAALKKVADANDDKDLRPRLQDYVKRVRECCYGDEVRRLIGLRYNASDVAFSPDGKRVAASAWGHAACVWDVASGKQLLRLKHDNYVQTVAWSPDGKTLATGGEGVWLWDPDTGKEKLRLRDAKGSIHVVRFTPDGKRIAAAGGVATNPTGAGLWEAATGDLVRRFDKTSCGYAVALSPDARRVFVTNTDRVICLDTESGRVIWAVAPAHPGETQRIRVYRDAWVTPDGKELVLGNNDGNLRVFDPASGDVIRAVQGRRPGDADWHNFDFGKDVVVHRDARNRICAWRIALSAKGDRLAAGGPDACVVLMDFALGKVVQRWGIPKDTSSVTCVAISPDGRHVAAGDHEGIVRIFRVEK